MVSFVDSALGGSSSPVSSNIQHYLAQATLPRLRLAPCTPRMPLANHKTHRNNLSIRPERYRKLRNIHRIKRDYLDARCLDFIQKHIPCTPVPLTDTDPDAYEQPSISCAGFDVVGFVPAPVRHIDGLRVMWLEDSILRTVQAALSMIPEYRDIVKNYTFTCNDIMRDEDHQIFRYFMWERSPDADANTYPTNSPAKFILAYQPPWILAPRDIELFADKRLKAIPSFEACEESGRQRYVSTHKLWAKLWDVCKQHNCSTFVLTNYNQWVFGGFSKGWVNGYTMGVKEAYPPDTKSMPKPDPKGKRPLPRTPSILEYLVYWTVSSMRLPDSFEVPPVPNEIDLEMAVDDSIDDMLPPILLPTHPNFGAPPTLASEPSESDWSSSSSEVPSSAGVRVGSESESGQSLPPFLTDSWRPPTDSAIVKRIEGDVHSWRRKVDAPDPGHAPSIPRPPSPVRSEWSDKSMATREPRRYQGFHNLDTVIFEEVYEYDLEAMDLT